MDVMILAQCAPMASADIILIARLTNFIIKALLRVR